MDYSSVGYRSRRRRRRRRVTSPSASVLSWLAVLASSEAAEGLPLSLGFLCPRTVEEEDLKARRRMPPKYVTGNDGLWRLTDSYTLYGSTMCTSCPSSTSSTLPTQTATTLELSGTTSTSSLASTTTPDILDSLPPGWQPQPHNGRTSLILALSLVLAFFIIFFIIGCIFWRSRVRKRNKSNDHERAPSRRGHDDDERLIEHEISAKKKSWAKAAARWKANARYLARRRRGRRNVSTALRTLQSSTSSVSIHPHSSGLSLTLSRRSTIDESVVAEAETNEQEHSLPPARAQSPPAYRQRISLTSTPTTSTIFPVASTSSGLNDSMSSIHFAHVATDDKTVLGQLSSLISSPPVQDHSLQISSAPVWHDEELSDYIEETSQDAPPSAGPSSVWPAPPSKGKMATYYDYEQSYDLGCDLTLGPDAEPSAPPFEEQVTSAPSAPPLEDLLAPSAPPHNLT